MLDPAKVDAAVDLAYGALILIAIVLIARLEFGIGLAFGLGVFAAYVVHVVWKMARFDPDWMTSAVQETVEETVGRQMEETVGETVEHMGNQLESMQAQVESVDKRIERRPREERVEELIEKTQNETNEE